MQAAASRKLIKRHEPGVRTPGSLSQSALRFWSALNATEHLRSNETTQRRRLTRSQFSKVRSLTESNISNSTALIHEDLRNALSTEVCCPLRGTLPILQSIPFSMKLCQGQR